MFQAMNADVAGFIFDVIQESPRTSESIKYRGKFHGARAFRMTDVRNPIQNACASSSFPGRDPLCARDEVLRARFEGDLCGRKDRLIMACDYVVWNEI